MIKNDIPCFRKEPIFPIGKRAWLIVRSVIGLINNTVGYFAVKHMPIGDMTMIAASSTFFACIYARIFLKEPIKLLNLSNILFVIVGILLISKPPFIFGGDENDIYSKDNLAKYAVAILTAQSIFLSPNIFITLRALKGSYTICQNDLNIILFEYISSVTISHYRMHILRSTLEYCIMPLWFHRLRYDTYCSNFS